MNLNWERIPDLFEMAPAQAGIVGRMPTLKSVAIYGLGHLGSWVGLALAKLGIKDITLNDFDTLEFRNVSGSVYNRRNLGIPKTEAMMSILQQEMYAADQEPLANIFGGGNKSLGYVNGNFRTFGFTFQTPADFYILATDNAWSRKKIAETIYKTWDMTKHISQLKGMNPVIIDVRSAGTKMTVINLPILDDELRERYLLELQNLAEEPGDIPCNEANIIQVPLYIASLVAQIVTSFCKGVEDYKMWTGDLGTLATAPYSMPIELHLPKIK